MLKKTVSLMRMTILLTGIFLVATQLASYGQVTPRSTTEIRWDFTEQSGIVTHAGNGNGPTGKLVGGVTWATDPLIDNSLRFAKTGASLLTDHLNTDIRNTFTVACWLKAAPDRSRARTILVKGPDETRPDYFRLALEPSTGYLRFYSPALSGDMNSGISVDDNNWHQVAVTYGQGRMKFYQDGRLVRTTAVTGSLESASSSLAIGGQADKTSSFGGNIAKLKIFNTVQNSVKIWNLYTNKLAGWDLDEGMGISTFRQYGNPLYGMLEGPINTYDNYGVTNTGWLKEAAWAKDPRFGSVVDFSAAGSSVSIDTTDVNLRNRFTITCWVKASPGRKESRVVLAKGLDEDAKSFFNLKLDAVTGKLNFHSPALTGNTNSGITVDDNRWHHVAVTYGQGQMRFYKDGILIRSNAVKGTIDDSQAPMSIGSLTDRTHSFAGSLARLRLFGSALTAENVKDLYYETESAGWDMEEGSGILVHDNNGAHYNGMIRKAVWVAGKGSSFSSVINFNEPGSGIAINPASINLNSRFTIAAWVQAPPSRDKARTILAKGKSGTPGSFSLGLEKGTGNLIFNAPRLSGDMNGGFQVDDNIWHHVMITYGNGEMKFYRDRQLVKTSKVKGTVTASADPLSIGSFVEGENSFGGNMSRLKIYNSVRIPEEVTKIVPPAGPALVLKRGVVFDRIQSQGFPVKPDYQVNANDVGIVKALGFDHVKLLFTADEFVHETGLRNMDFIDQVVNMALASGLPCVVDLHPEGKFKAHYLGTDTGFVKMLAFYKAFSKHLADRWTPKQVAFQLMTEPFGNKDGDWNEVTRKMVAAVRSEMPDHTLIVSGDRAGNIYAMTGMIPINDDNIYYSFTTYEPYRFGFNTLFGGWRGSNGFYKDISYMPWPTSPEIVAGRMDEMLSTVKDADKAKAREHLVEYGKGHFNSQWLQLRAKNVSEWNDSYGGNLHIMVAEFGAVDHIQSRKSGGASHGVYPQERIQFVHDLRRSFESVGMGWEYWSFNEYFTILDPATRKAYQPASMSNVDTSLIKALGVF